MLLGRSKGSAQGTESFKDNGRGTWRALGSLGHGDCLELSAHIARRHGPPGAREGVISARPAKLLRAGTQRPGEQGGPAVVREGGRGGARQVTFWIEAEGGPWPPGTFPRRRMQPCVRVCACASAQAKGCTRTKSWGLGIGGAHVETPDLAVCCSVCSALTLRLCLSLSLSLTHTDVHAPHSTAPRPELVLQSPHTQCTAISPDKAPLCSSLHELIPPALWPQLGLLTRETDRERERERGGGGRGDTHTYTHTHVHTQAHTLTTTHTRACTHIHHYHTHTCTHTHHNTGRKSEAVGNGKKDRDRHTASETLREKGEGDTGSE